MFELTPNAKKLAFSLAAKALKGGASAAWNFAKEHPRTALGSAGIAAPVLAYNTLGRKIDNNLTARKNQFNSTGKPATDQDYKMARPVLGWAKQLAAKSKRLRGWNESLQKGYLDKHVMPKAEQAMKDQYAAIAEGKITPEEFSNFSQKPIIDAGTQRYKQLRDRAIGGGLIAGTAIPTGYLGYRALRSDPKQPGMWDNLSDAIGGDAGNWLKNNGATVGLGALGAAGLYGLSSLVAPDMPAGGRAALSLAGGAGLGALSGKKADLVDTAGSVVSGVGDVLKPVGKGLIKGGQVLSDKISDAGIGPVAQGAIAGAGILGLGLWYHNKRKQQEAIAAGY
jgi:hypothetical protein